MRRPVHTSTVPSIAHAIVTHLPSNWVNTARVISVSPSPVYSNTVGEVIPSLILCGQPGCTPVDRNQHQQPESKRPAVMVVEHGVKCRQVPGHVCQHDDHLCGAQFRSPGVLAKVE